MSKEILDTLRLFIEEQHNCKATYQDMTHIREVEAGITIWEGDVYIFLVKGLPNVETAYAWSTPENDQVYAVLESETVHSVYDALDKVSAAVSDS